MRIDKWLFFTRLVKTRSQAAALVDAGQVRLNDRVVGKAAQAVKPGDELVFPTGKRWRRVVVLGLGVRRGPASEAQALYQDLEPPPPADPWDL